VVRAAAAVVTPSRWCRAWLLERHELDPARVCVAHPGVDDTPTAARSQAGDRLLCVGAVAPGKGQDLLLDALERIADLSWHCRCIGPDALAPDFVAQLRRRARHSGLGDRFRIHGPRAGDELAAAYAESDALVVASRAETYGMVVTEALARGIPAIVADGGPAEALGVDPEGQQPGAVVPRGDSSALAAELRRWLIEPGRREELRLRALATRPTLAGWDVAADRVHRALAAGG
jgi:glycosyltransferase involved in cell wall biosynthesis